MTPALVIYLAERIIRWLWPSVRSAELVDVHLLPGKERVICLRVARPMSFHYSCAPRHQPTSRLVPIFAGMFGPCGIDIEDQYMFAQYTKPPQCWQSPLHVGVRYQPWI